MLIRTIFVGAGLFLTLVLGWYCERFLKKSVIAKSRIAGHDPGGGGQQLGVLERLLFFASFLLGEYTIAGGWLVFKAAAKWAAWQHIARLPDSGDSLAVQDRISTSSRLLGRFLNGTLYNALCACMGVVAANFASFFLKSWLKNASPDWLLWPFAGSEAIILIGLISIMLFRDWPKYRDDGMPELSLSDLWRSLGGKGRSCGPKGNPKSA
jgi:hypothetical protein